MSVPPLNPTQHVERIREIIMGRDLNQVHGRLSRIENGLERQSSAESSAASPQLQTAFTQLQNECRHLREELQHEKTLRQTQLAHIDQHLRQLAQQPPSHSPSFDSDQLASEMAARIDARFREMLTHLQTELLQWKGQLDRDLQAIREIKVDRKELANRFAKLASAAMEESDIPTPKDGYLL